MNILTGLTGLVIGAVAAWQVARGWAAAELSHLRAYLEEQIGYWQCEAERAKIHAAQLSEQTAAWVTGCQQGREDVLSVARALAQRPAGISGSRWPPSPSAPEDHWRIGGLARVARGAVAGTLLVAGFRRGRQAAPAWPAWPAECDDQPWTNRLPVSRCRHQFR